MIPSWGLTPVWTSSVWDYLTDSHACAEMVDDIERLVTHWLPRLEDESRSCATPPSAVPAGSTVPSMLSKTRPKRWKRALWIADTAQTAQTCQTANSVKPLCRLKPRPALWLAFQTLEKKEQTLATNGFTAWNKGRKAIAEMCKKRWYGDWNADARCLRLQRKPLSPSQRQTNQNPKQTRSCRPRTHKRSGLTTTTAAPTRASYASIPPKLAHTATSPKLPPRDDSSPVRYRQILCASWFADIPNVGKSTVINVMICKKSAKTCNEPGITKAEQRLFLADDFCLYDTPECCGRKSSSKKAATTLPWRCSRTQRVGRRRSRLELLDYTPHATTSLCCKNATKPTKTPAATGTKTFVSGGIVKKRGAVLSGGGRINLPKSRRRHPHRLPSKAKSAESPLKRWTNGKLGSKFPVRKKPNSKPCAKPAQQSV